MAMSSEYRTGEELGMNAGYDDANYADAYGGGTNAEKAFLKRIGSATTGDFRSGFLTGYAEGVERFKNDTPRS